jgi:prolyl-tRNA editing enzyme YbaK/EbsC (Cys-tRNA(Pro) deacylase)
LPVYAEAGIFALPKIVINGGRRGFLVEIAPQDIEKVIPVTRVEVAIGGPAE